MNIIDKMTNFNEIDKIDRTIYSKQTLDTFN